MSTRRLVRPISVLGPVAASIAIAACSGAQDGGSTSPEHVAFSQEELSTPRGGGRAANQHNPGGASNPADDTCATTKGMSKQVATAPTLANPKVYFLFWGGYWQSGTGLSEYNSYTSQWSFMAGSDSFYKQLAEYGISDGKYLGASVQKPNFGGLTTIPEQGASGTSSITGQLLAEVGHNGVPARDANTLYVIMMPNGISSNYCKGKCGGHHQAATLQGTDPSISSTNIYYAVMEYNSSMATTNTTIAHEIYEGITDPVIGTAWCDNTATKPDGTPAHDCGQNEIGDCCDGQQQSLRGDTVQKVWSQARQQCLASPVQMLQHIALIQNSTPYYTARVYPFWDNYQPILASTGQNLVEMQEVAGTGTQEMTFDGTTLWHTIRDSSGNYPFFANASAAMGTSLNVYSMGMADVVNPSSGADDMHLCAIGSDGNLYHGVRFTSPPSWQSLNSTVPVIGSPGFINTTDCAGFGNDLQIAVTTNTGAVYHTIRFGASQTWQSWGQVSTDISGETAIKVSAANVNGDLHLVAITREGNAYAMWHNIRFSSPPSWQGWQKVPGALSTFNAVSVATVNNELNVVAASNTSVGGNGHAYHSIRHSGGWDSFNDITAPAGNPGVVFGNQPVAATGSTNDSW
jgi:hypothetical protein